MFFFYFEKVAAENVGARGKEDIDTDINLLSFLQGREFGISYRTLRKMVCTQRRNLAFRKSRKN